MSKRIIDLGRPTYEQWGPCIVLLDRPIGGTNYYTTCPASLKGDHPLAIKVLATARHADEAEVADEGGVM